MNIVTLIAVFALIAILLPGTLSMPALALAAEENTGGKNLFPETPLGQAARRYVEAVSSSCSSSETDALTLFIHEYYSEAAMRRATLEEHRAELATLARQSGGLEVISVAPQGRWNTLRFTVRSKRGGHRAEVHLYPGSDNPARINGFNVLPLPDPEAEKAEIWPAEKVSEAEIVRVIETNAACRAAQDRFSGVVLVAKDDGKVLLHRAYGMADKDQAAPNRLDTKFHLGSMNKMFTSIAIAQLVQAGKLSYDDTLVKVLPEYPNKEAAKKITVRHLLTHTAGLGGLFERRDYDRRMRYRRHVDYLPVFAGEPLAFEPGTRFSYSNEGFVVLGAVIEKLTGRDYLDYVREHIYRPAQMRDSDSFALDEVTPNRAVGYMRYSEDDPLGIEPRRPNYMFLGWRGNACGGGYSTAPDLLKFARALRGYKLLSKEMTEKITGSPDEMLRARDYAFGFSARRVAGRDVRGHNGGGMNSGINSDLKIFWDSGYTVIVLGNYDAPAATHLSDRIAAFLARQ